MSEVNHIAILRSMCVQAMNRLENAQGFMMHETELTAHWESEFYRLIDGGYITRARVIYNRICQQIDAYEMDGHELGRLLKLKSK